jgi:hypothetical protein
MMSGFRVGFDGRDGLEAPGVAEAADRSRLERRPIDLAEVRWTVFLARAHPVGRRGGYGSRMTVYKVSLQ